MKIHDCIQGTPQWSALRAGVPTASQFHRILTPSGKRSEQRDGYKMDLLAERMLGRPLDPYKSLPMQQGSITEAEAVAYYSFQRDVKTERVGFVTNDEETVGASPDRFVGNCGLLEIKCPEAGTHVGFLLKSGSAYAKYKTQCNGQLWICEREFVDIMSYFPELPEALARIERDPKFIAILAEAVLEFSAELERAFMQIVNDGWVKREPWPPVITDQDQLVKALKDSLAGMKR